MNLTSALQASGALSVFPGEVERDALIQEALAITRVEVSLREVPVAPEALAGQAAVGEAEHAAVETVREVGARMSRPPSAADGVDPFAVSMTTSFGLSRVASEAMQEAMQAQADQADAAASYGRRANLASLALLLAALALSVATLAGTATDRSGRWVKNAAGTLLVLTSVVAVVALVV
ncbi:MAG: hypothetical protein JWP95_458 [Actinotalea sp.]|nr:hypothetical protein [Actinotalea sp.]